MEWVALRNWKNETDSPDGIFLLNDLFQLRTIAPVFSEVSLDIVEFTTKPVIYHTEVNHFLKNGPISDGIVKFALIKEPFWNKVLFRIGQLIIVQENSKGQLIDVVMKEKFPLWNQHVKEMYLGADGLVKIIKG